MPAQFVQDGVQLEQGTVLQQVDGVRGQKLAIQGQVDHLVVDVARVFIQDFDHLG